MNKELLEALAVIAAQLQIQNEIATGIKRCEIYDGKHQDEIDITSMQSIDRLAERFMARFTGTLEDSDFYGYADGMERTCLTEANFLIERAKRK
jgi:hypothetical protein